MGCPKSTFAAHEGPHSDSDDTEGISASQRKNNTLALLQNKMFPFFPSSFSPNPTSKMEVEERCVK